MLRHYLKLAFRQISGNKTFSLINFAGLSIGFTLFMLIFLWAKDEFSYDKFHDDHQRIYRISWHAKYGANEWNVPAIPVPVGPTLEEQYPEVAFSTQVISGGMTLEKDDSYVREQHGAFVDENFHEVFTVEFLSGHSTTALEDPSSIVLTSEMAKRYFPDESPMGKELLNNQGTIFKVTGIVKPWPDQSHFKFDYLIPLHSLEYVRNRQNSWGFSTVWTYVKLSPGSDVTALSTQFEEYVDSEILEDDFDRENNFVNFPFQKISDIHLRSDLQDDVAGNGSITYVYLFSLLAVFILLLACINFINLSTARSLFGPGKLG